MDALSDPTIAEDVAIVTADVSSEQTSTTENFTRHSLGRICTLVRTDAIEAGVAPRDVEDLLIAVSEIVTNAIRYAGGAGSVRLQRLDRGLLTEIRDDGPGLPDGVLSERPSVDRADGRGLWLAQLLCPDMEIVSSAHGVTVRIFTARMSGP